MKSEQRIEMTDTTNATQRHRKPSPFLHLTEACAHNRTIRIRLPLPRRESCLTKRAMIAALREVELCEGLAGRGVFFRTV